jgi:hypothetical protein
VRPTDGEEALVYSGAEEAVYDHDLSVGYEAIEARAREMPDGRARLRFLTPTRLKHGGKYVSEPAFHVIIRAILRRVSSLYYFHCGERWDFDYRGAIERAERVKVVRMQTEWVDWSRYSGRQRAWIKLGGFTGEMEYEGELAEFRPLLALGELVHIGKACVFGNGRMVVGD